MPITMAGAFPEAALFEEAATWWCVPHSLAVHLLVSQHANTYPADSFPPLRRDKTFTRNQGTVTSSHFLTKFKVGPAPL